MSAVFELELYTKEFLVDDRIRSVIGAWSDHISVRSAESIDDWSYGNQTKIAVKDAGTLVDSGKIVLIDAVYRGGTNCGCQLYRVEPDVYCTSLWCSTRGFAWLDRDGMDSENQSVYDAFASGVDTSIGESLLAAAAGCEMSVAYDTSLEKMCSLSRHVNMYMVGGSREEHLIGYRAERRGHTICFYREPQ